MSDWDLGSVESLSRIVEQSTDDAIKTKAKKALACILDEVPKKAEVNELRAIGYKLLFGLGCFGIILIPILWGTKILSFGLPSVTLMGLCAGSLVLTGKPAAGK